MPTPVFGQVVITAGNDPLTPVVAYSSGRSESLAVQGTVDTYANGRQRSIAQVGVKHTFVLTLRDVSDLPVTLPSPGSGTINPLDLLMTTWLGVRILFRDARGRYFEGVYFNAAISDRKTPHLYDVALSIAELTPEGV